MSQIYMWNASLLDQEVGHVSLKLSDGTYISHWPADQKKAFGTVRGDKYTFYDDVEVEGRQPDETLDLPAGMLDEDAIKKWWCKYVGDYNVLMNNCAQVVHKALIQGGAMKLVSNTPDFLLLPMSTRLMGLPRLPSNSSEAILTPADLMKFARYCKTCYLKGPVPRVPSGLFGPFF